MTQKNKFSDLISKKPYNISFLVESGNGNIRKLPVRGVIPTLNMGKSLPEKTTPQRKERNLAEVNSALFIVNQVAKVTYKTLQDVIESALKLKTIQTWEIKATANKLMLKKKVKPWGSPEIKICIDDSLGYTISVFDWLIPEDHQLYKKNKRTLKYTTLLRLINEIEQHQICEGQHPSLDGNVIHHVVPNTEETSDDEESEMVPFVSKTFYRTKRCLMLIQGNSNPCIECHSNNQLQSWQSNSKQRNSQTAAKLKAPLSATDRGRVVLALKQERLKCHQLSAELEKMKIELSNNTHTIDHSLNNDFLNILSDTDTKITPFMSLFWQQQKRLFQASPKGMRYHPMIIR